jgi:hypothetical protein
MQTFKVGDEVVLRQTHGQYHDKDFGKRVRVTQIEDVPVDAQADAGHTQWLRIEPIDAPETYSSLRFENQYSGAWFTSPEEVLHA